MIQIQLRKRREFIKKINFAMIYAEISIQLMAKHDWERCKQLLEYALNDLSDCYELIGGMEKEKEA